MAEPFELGRPPYRIALDMDGVLADSHTVMADVTEELHGYRLEPSTVYQWGAEKVMFHLSQGKVKLTGQEFLDLFDVIWARWRDIPPVDPYAKGVIEELRDDGHTVHIVTYAKTKEQMGFKAEWLAKNVMPSLWMVNSRELAGWKYEMDYDVFIEDCPHIAVGARQQGKIAILYDQPWNRGVDRRLIDFRVTSLNPVPYCIDKALASRGIT